MKQVLPIVILTLVVYLVSNLVVPIAFSGENIFLVNIFLWTAIIIANVYLIRKHSVGVWRTDRTILWSAVIMAAFQLFLAVFVSFFAGFGKNSMMWSPKTLAIYFPFLLAPFLGTELSRVYLTRAANLRKPTLGIFVISLYFTFIRTSIPAYQSLSSPLLISEFLIKSFIPMLAIGLFATYLTYHGNLPASLIYMSIPTFFSWFSPILPNPPWAVKSIIDVAVSTMGFLMLSQTMPNHLFVSLTSTRRSRDRRAKKTQLPYWTVVSLIALILVWSSSGLLGFTPTIIGSGSMTPTLNLGDITFVVSASPETIEIGDIIQYQTQDKKLIHRVIDKYEAGGSLSFITQGDANNSPDDPINERQVIGKVVFTIPQLGWVSIALKNLAANTYTFLTTTLPQTLANAWTQITTNGIYITSALAFTAYSFLLLTYKNRKKEEKT